MVTLVTLKTILKKIQNLKDPKKSKKSPKQKRGKINLKKEEKQLIKKATQNFQKCHKFQESQKSLIFFQKN